VRGVVAWNSTWVSMKTMDDMTFWILHLPSHAPSSALLLWFIFPLLVIRTYLIITRRTYLQHN